MTQRVAVLCLERLVAFDLAIAVEAFSTARGPGGERLYDVEACAPQPGDLATTTGFRIAGLAGLDVLDRADTVVVPAARSLTEPPAQAVLDGLRGVVDRGGRAVSICAGTFALAYAGLLDGRRATTHWEWADALAAAFPRIDVDPDALYIDEGEVLTSAGLSAGIDLCLYIIRRDHGERVGADVARAMVAAPHRDGGQAQFIERALPSPEGSLAAVRAWALENLAQPLDVATLARRAAVSPRTFARRFVAETGTTPLKWLQAQRLLEARRLLERTDLSVERIALASGFGSAPSLREHFRRSLATTPTAYRRAFAAAPGVAA
jgi:transcriptional regulator GlxA family with amidase domain